MSPCSHTESNLLSTLIEHFPNGIVTLFDESLRYQIAGGTGFDDSGPAPEDLEGRRLQDVFPEENVQKIEPLYRRALAGESSITEVELDGRIFRIHIVPVHDSDGDVFAGMTMSQDVTEQRRRERELRETKQRYETILQASPDPIFVADVETGEIVEVNDAAVAFRGQPREELIGLHQSELHPPDPDDSYRELFDEHIRAGGTKRRLPDGSPIYAESADGERTPVAISVGTMDLADGSYILGMFRDISDQLSYERALTGLTAATRDLFTAAEQTEIADAVVRVVTDVLDMTGAAVYLFDETDGVLRSVSQEHHPGSADGNQHPPEFEPGESIAWRVYSSGRPAVLDDAADAVDVAGDVDSIRSQLVYPLGEWGVVAVGEGTADAFDSEAEELIELLATTATAAFDRASQYRELQNRERELEARTAQLAHSESINNRIRDIVQVLVNARTRVEILEAVCAELVDADVFEFAWIGTLESEDGQLKPRQWSGAHATYLESIDWTLQDGRDDEPAITTAVTGTAQHVRNTAQDLPQESWRDSALTRGFKSVLSVPLSYQGTNHGVLSVYAGETDAFPQSTRSVLVELGELIAHALAGLDRKQALLTNQATELEFSVQDRGCFFMRVAQETGCELELESMVPGADESLLVVIRILDGETDQFVEYAEDATIVEHVRGVTETDGSRFQLRFVQPIFASIWAEQGIVIHQISADTRGCSITVAVPPTYDVRQVVEVVTAMFPQAELVAKRDGVDAAEAVEALNDELTARQYETLELAYTNGYFEMPRGARSEELADRLDISVSAFHQHLRTAEQTLVRSFFEGRGSED